MFSFTFQIWGAVFSRMSGIKLSKGVVLGCIHLVAGLMCC